MVPRNKGVRLQQLADPPPVNTGGHYFHNVLLYEVLRPSTQCGELRRQVVRLEEVRPRPRFPLLGLLSLDAIAADFNRRFEVGVDYMPRVYDEHPVLADGTFEDDARHHLAHFGDES